ncbi:MAG: cofactor-independent phosphoglycerate mutase [Candidatus Methylomirabilia bacterium]
MKYLILIPDGAADWAVPVLGGKTPLEAAATPNLDRLAREGEFGRVQTVPAGMEPGSDVAGMSLFGNDPAQVYTGRAPLEAASMGVALGDLDVALRCNLVSTGGAAAEDPAALMVDYSAGHITTEEGRRIVEDFRGSDVYRERYIPDFELFPGVGYRHLLVWRGGSTDARLTPPHDILGQPLADHLPCGGAAPNLLGLMALAYPWLRLHPVNRDRRTRGLGAADNFWFWGAGRRPALQPFHERYGLSGAVISAVDLVNGIGVLLGLERVTVPGATGYVETNYRGKADYALAALARHDLVFVHIEAPDEAGHSGDAAQKVQALERIDREFLGPALKGLAKLGPHRVLVAPDHYTPIARRSHVGEAVPFLVWPGGGRASGVAGFSEAEAAKTGVFVERGHELLGRLFAAGQG